MSDYTTREILDMIEEHGGPKGLDLSGEDLSGIDLGRKTIKKELESLREKNQNADPPWWSDEVEGIDLRAANLKGATLAGANLNASGLAATNLAGANLRGVSLTATLWHANLEGADLTGANLEGATFRGTNVSRLDLRDADSIKSIYLYRAQLEQTQLTKHQIGRGIGEEIEAIRETRPDYWLEAKETYLALKNNFEQLGRYDDASWAYRKERRMEKREAWRLAKDAFQEHDWGSVIRKVWKAGWDLAIEYLCDYGESVGRVLSWMGFVILIAGPLILGAPGLLRWPEANYDAFFGLPVPRRYAYAYVQQLLYVLDAFTTASFAELQPAKAAARLLSAFMALIGVFLTGLLGFVAGNRIRQS